MKFADVQIVTAAAGTYTVVINAVNHDFVAGGGDTVTTIRDGLIAAVNGGAQPVQALAIDTDRFIIFPDDPVSAADAYSTPTANMKLFTGFMSTKAVPSSPVASLVDGNIVGRVYPSIHVIVAERARQ